MGDEICEVVVTADDPDWLAALSRALVAERLIACAQQVAPIQSIYRWGGRVEEATEARVALHTRVDLVPRLIDRIRRDHPYSVPCVLALPVLGAHPDYAAWVCSETGPGPAAPGP